MKIRHLVSGLALTAAMLSTGLSPASALEEDRDKCSIGMSGCSIIHIAPNSDPGVAEEYTPEPGENLDEYDSYPEEFYSYYGNTDDYSTQQAYYGGLFGSCNFNITFEDGSNFRGQVEIYPLVGTAEVRLRASGRGYDASRLVRIDTTQAWAVSFCDRHGGDWR